MMAGDIIFFRVPNSLQGCDEWGDGREILYIKTSLVQWKDIRPWRPEFGPERKHFVSRTFCHFWGSSEAAMGAPRLARLMSPKNGCAQRTCARAAKTH